MLNCIREKSERLIYCCLSCLNIDNYSWDIINLATSPGTPLASRRGPLSVEMFISTGINHHSYICSTYYVLGSWYIYIYIVFNPHTWGNWNLMRKEVKNFSTLLRNYGFRCSSIADKGNISEPSISLKWQIKEF